MERSRWQVVHTTLVHGYEDGTVVTVEPGDLIELTEDEAFKLGDNVRRADPEDTPPKTRRKT